MNPDKFVHTVLFWLKNSEAKEDRLAFETSIKKFIKNSEYVQASHIGIPAATNRPVIDNSYTYALTVTFNSLEDHDKYQVEPAHKTFIEESKALWEKVLIYDAIDIL